MRDVAIIGGGAAGLAAALILGRCRRTVTLFDSGKPRNRFSNAMHGYLTRDGISPSEFFESARAELEKYETVELRRGLVSAVTHTNSVFSVESDGSPVIHVRRLLIATGVVDQLPDVAGLAERFGKSVFHCPYCDGWEFRDRALGVVGDGKKALKMTQTLRCWTEDIAVFLNGGEELDGGERSALEKLGAEIYDERISAVEGEGDTLELIRLESGRQIPRSALFLAGDTVERTQIAKSLGCNVNERGGIDTSGHSCTSVTGVYAAGDALQEVQFVAVAAAQGVEAAVGINLSLLQEDFPV